MAKKGNDRADQDSINLFKFTDWLLILPEDYKLSFWEELRTYEEERQMPYITSVEQMGYDRGIVERGRSIALNMLRKKLDVETIAEITELTIAEIQNLRSQLEAE